MPLTGSDLTTSSHSCNRSWIARSGSWKIAGAQIVFGSSRNPTLGFLSLREEIVVGIRDQSLRWGAVDFGPGQSGDVMHFDRNKQPTMTVDANPNGIFFTSKLPKP